jgi:hypothetical protein
MNKISSKVQSLARRIILDKKAGGIRENIFIIFKGSENVNSSKYRDKFPFQEYSAVVCVLPWISHWRHIVSWQHMASCILPPLFSAKFTRYMWWPQQRPSWSMCVATYVLRALVWPQSYTQVAQLQDAHRKGKQTYMTHAEFLILHTAVLSELAHISARIDFCTYRSL